MSDLPSITNNRTYLQKADLALADLVSGGGYLLAEQSAKFIRLLIKESKLFPMVTVDPMKSHTKKIPKSRFNSRVLKPGAEATALPIADRSKIDLTNVDLTTTLIKGEVRMSYETLEDNIEGESFQETVMAQLAERMALDMEELVVNGDTASADAYLALFDGILKQATSNIVNAALATMQKSIMRDMLKTMPSEWLRNKASMRFLTSVDAELDYRDTLADRMTMLGDASLAADATTNYSGIPVIPIPMFPENLGVGSNTTNVILTDPKNINVGIWRNIRLETDRLVPEGVIVIVGSLRMGVKYVEELAVVKATNVRVV